MEKILFEAKRGYVLVINNHHFFTDITRWNNKEVKMLYDYIGDFFQTTDWQDEYLKNLKLRSGLHSDLKVYQSEIDIKHNSVSYRSDSFGGGDIPERIHFIKFK